MLAAPDVDIAVLETARGGILKRGLAFDRCDVSIVLNVTSDHLGMDGIETVEDLARVKNVVARAALKALVLNAEDERCLAMASTRRKSAEVLYFSMNASNPVLLRHLERRGRAAYLQGDCVIVADGKRRHSLIEVAQMPVAMGGHARFNIANALATAAGMLAGGFALFQITACLATFVSNSHNNPLRSNKFDVRGVTVIVDYAHNPAAYAALGEMARLMAPERTVAVVAAPGDRRDADLREIGATCARAFDTIIAYESETRGRTYGETPDLILNGARAVRHDDSDLYMEHHIHVALRKGLSQCCPGDVLIFTCASSVMELVDALRDSDPETANRIAAEIGVESGSSCTTSRG